MTVSRRDVISRVAKPTLEGTIASLQAERHHRAYIGRGPLRVSRRDAIAEPTSERTIIIAGLQAGRHRRADIGKGLSRVSRRDAIAAPTSEGTIAGHQAPWHRRADIEFLPASGLA